MPLRGGVTCRVPSGMWMVPPHCGVWVPGGMPHSNVATANARLFFLFVEPGAADLPNRCCTLSLSPLVTGLLFGRWRQQLQLIVAIRSLAAGATVQEVSGDLGYESVSAFITMFKKALGTSPSKYLSNFDR